MTVYVIAQLRFTNRPVYDRYQAAFMDVFKRFNGQLLIADERPRTLEGQWDREKLVVMSFPDEAEAQRFMTAPDYVEITKDRKAGADAVVLLARGVGG